MLISGNLLPLMGVEPTIGRAFRPEEDEVPGRDAVVILGRTMWEQEFGGRRRCARAARVRINGVPFTIIGVAPASFTGMDRYVRYDFFIPLMMSPRVIADSKAASLEARDVRNLDAERTAEAWRVAGAGAERADGDCRRSRARLSRDEQEPAVSS